MIINASVDEKLLDQDENYIFHTWIFLSYLNNLSMRGMEGINFFALILQLHFSYTVHLFFNQVNDFEVIMN